MGAVGTRCLSLIPYDIKDGHIYTERCNNLSRYGVGRPRGMALMIGSESASTSHECSHEGQTSPA